MKKIYSLNIVLFWFVSLNIIFSQDYGKIFTKDEANSKFGSVHEVFTIKKEVLNIYLQKTENVIMFKFVNNELLILGDGRKILQGKSNENYSDLIFHVFSKEIVRELLNKHIGEEIYIENREDVLTISYGNNTLELSLPCPPYCE